jgi:hypothetical protein
MNRSPNATINVILESFPKSTVLVIEDVMLDEYIAGKASRISPEAPVPIVPIEEVDRMTDIEDLHFDLLASRCLASSPEVRSAVKSPGFHERFIPNGAK